MLTLQLTPFTPLYTERLTLRQLTEADAPAIQFFRSDEQFLRQHLQLLNNLLTANEGITWALSLRGQPALLGTVCLWNLQPTNHRAELGYGLLPQFEHQGFMIEAVAAVLRYGFERLGLHSIEAQVAPENTASSRLLEKLGFVREGLFRENIYFQGRFLDTAVYSLLASAYS